MPRTTASGCVFTEPRPDLARHDFAGAAAPVLDLIAAYYPDDIDLQEAIAVSRPKAVSMLERGASLELEQACGSLMVRVINETGHKLPTGHIEGRRVWLNVLFRDGGGQTVGEYGHYDTATAHLAEDTTQIYEMHVGLSEAAAKLTGYPAGTTSHMALADTIEKDNRIPPRGFTNAAFEAGGAPVVAATYADGQYWGDSYFSIPDGAVLAEVTVNYQSLPDHYMEALRDGNVTDHWGDTLYSLWEETGKGAPIRMATDDPGDLAVGSFMRGDIDCDGSVGIVDFLFVLSEWGKRFSPADLDGSTEVGVTDLMIVLMNWG